LTSLDEPWLKQREKEREANKPTIDET